MTPHYTIPLGLHRTDSSSLRYVSRDPTSFSLLRFHQCYGPHLRHAVFTNVAVAFHTPNRETRLVAKIWTHENGMFLSLLFCHIRHRKVYTRFRQLTLVLSVSGTMSWMESTTCSRLYSSSPITSTLYIGASSTSVDRFVLVTFFTCVCLKAV